MGVWASVGVFADGETSFSYTYDSSGVSQAVPEPYKAYAPISGKKSFGGVQLNDPKDIYVSEKGEIYILDSGNSRIAVLSSSLEFERDIRLIRNGNRVDLNGAEGIFVSASDKIYVADKSGAAVYTADNDGNTHRSFPHRLPIRWKAVLNLHRHMYWQTAQAWYM